LKGVIFDLGGVVVEWSNDVTYRHIEEKYGISAADFKAVAEKGMPGAQTGEASEEEWMKKTFHRFGEYPPETWRVWGTTFEAAHYNDAVVSLITRLRNRGVRVAALSNLEPSRARWLKRRNINSIFDVVVFSCEVGMRKPDLNPGGREDLAIYRLALERLDLKPGECVFVDDNVNCVTAAKQVGIKGIQYKNAIQLEDEFKKMGVGFD
jgi:HAD superfamily hydrolase (TIGR01509 family)